MKKTKYQSPEWAILTMSEIDLITTSLVSDDAGAGDDVVWGEL